MYSHAVIKEDGRFFNAQGLTLMQLQEAHALWERESAPKLPFGWSELEGELALGGVRYLVNRESLDSIRSVVRWLEWKLEKAGLSDA